VQKPREVFISHSSHDQRDADELVRVLGQRRIRTFYSPHHLRAASEWYREIGAALQRCDWFLILLTPSAVKSMWVERELTFALNNERYRGRIVPMLLHGCNYASFSWALSTVQVIDATNGLEAGCRELFRTWRIKYRPEL
jgi:hypothetical protein